MRKVLCVWVVDEEGVVCVCVVVDEEGIVCVWCGWWMRKVLCVWCGWCGCCVRKLIHTC